MLLSDGGSIVDCWMLVGGTVLDVFSCNFGVVECSSDNVLWRGGCWFTLVSCGNF